MSASASSHATDSSGAAGEIDIGERDVHKTFSNVEWSSLWAAGLFGQSKEHGFLLEWIADVYRGDRTDSSRMMVPTAMDVGGLDAIRRSETFKTLLWKRFAKDTKDPEEKHTFLGSQGNRGIKKGDEAVEQWLTDAELDDQSRSLLLEYSAENSMNEAGKSAHRLLSPLVAAHKSIYNAIQSIKDQATPRTDTATVSALQSLQDDSDDVGLCLEKILGLRAPIGAMNGLGIHQPEFPPRTGTHAGSIQDSRKMLASVSEDIVVLALVQNENLEESEALEHLE